MKRSAERAQFLTDVIITAAEGGIQYWAVILSYKWHLPNLPGGTGEPGPGGNAAASLKFRADEDDADIHTVTISDVARALGVIADLSRPLRLHSTDRARIAEASRENDGGQIDADDADVIIQVAAFGNVVYG